MAAPLAGRLGASAALVLLLAPGAAAEDWVLARSPGFVVVSERGELQARKVAQQFEQFRALIRELFDARVDPGRLVVVFDLADQHSMEALAGPSHSGVQPAGFFVPDPGAEKHFIVMRGDVRERNKYGGPDPARGETYTVHHEYVHLLNRLNFRALPPWADEGLAEFYETAEIDDDSIRIGRVTPYHLGALKGSTLALADVFAATRASPLYRKHNRQGPFYAYSALLVHYLSFEPTRRGQLSKYLGLLRKDVPSADAAREAFGDFAALESDLKGYARRQTFTAVTAPTRVDTTPVQAVGLKPHEANALRADFMARRGRRQEARRLLEPMLAVTPGQAIAHEAMGILEVEEGRPARALEHFAEAARLAPQSIVGPFQAGLVKMPAAPGDRARREASLRKVLEINAGFAPAHAALARVLLEADQPGLEAVNLAARASALDPGVLYYRLLLWHAFDRTGDVEKAAQLLPQLKRAALADTTMLPTLAFHLEEVGRPAEAESLLREAQGKDPMAETLLVYFLGRHRRWEEVLALDRAALARDPESAVRLNGVAYDLAQLGRDLPEALRLVERALKKSPRNADYLDTKAVVLLGMGRLAEAETASRAALAVEAADPEIVAHLADVLAARGKREESIAVYERALGMSDVTPRLRDEIRARLEAARKTGG